MKILRRAWSRVADVARRRGDFDAELQSHLDLHIADNIRAGMTPDEARRNALVALGGVEPTRERYRDALRAGWLDSFVKDVQFGARTLYRNAGFTTLAIVTLAVGMAATNTAFTIVNTVLLRDLPFDRPDRIVQVGIRDGRDAEGELHLSFADFQDWKRATRSFESIGVFGQVNLNLGDNDRAAEGIDGAYVSAGTFRVLRVQPRLGRDFTNEDDRPGAAPVVILGSQLWQSRYGGDPAILGRTVRVNAQPVTVIGVMADDFDFPFNNRLWLPLSMVRGISEEPREARWLQAIGRLADGATAAGAAAELTVINASIAGEPSDVDGSGRIETWRFRPGIGAPWYIILGALMAAVGLLLFVSCANVANLLLARSIQRTREVSIRTSLGATRWHVVRQLLVESVMLALAAGAVALPLSMGGMHILISFVDQIGKPAWMNFSMDARVFFFLAATCVGAGILFGVVPSLYISKRGGHEMLKRTAGRTATAGGLGRTLTSSLVVVELVVTIVLVSGAVSMMRHLAAETRMGRAIDTHGMLTLNLFLSSEKYADRDALLGFYRRLEEQFAAGKDLPIAIADSRPFMGGRTQRVSLDGHVPQAGEQLPSVQTVTIGPRYFEVLGVQARQGRILSDEDGMPGSEVVVVNERFVEEFLPGGEPLARTFSIVGEDKELRRVTIAGVVPTLRRDQMSRDVSVVYVPYLLNPNAALVLLARPRTSTAAAVATLREQVRLLDPDLPLFNIRTLDDVLSELLWVNRIFGGMFVIFALMALLIAAVGIYGVVSFTTAQRTQEIGIRTALGAPRGHLWWTMMRSRFVQIGIGLGVGSAAALLLLRLMGGMLVGRFGEDPVTLALSAGFLLNVTVIAMVLPIWRATSGNPVAALRYE